MGLDTTRLSTLALELIEHLADGCEDAEGVEVGVVALVVEVNGDFEGEPSTWVTYRCTDSRRWVQRGLFEQVSRAVLES